MIVLVSGDAKKKEWKDLIYKLGGKVIEDISEDFNIMISDSKLIRNCKLLQAFNLGASIVSLQWLKDSQKAKKFVNIEEKHRVYDKAFETQYKCNLKTLYSNQGVGELLKDQRIFISEKIESPSSVQTKLLIESAGG